LPSSRASRFWHYPGAHLRLTERIPEWITEAEAELDGLLQIAQDAFGGEWETGDSGARPCQLPSGKTGVTYALARYGPPLPLDQQPGAIDTTVAGWTASDFTPVAGSDSLEGIEISTVAYPTSGTDSDGIFMDLRVGERGSSVSGQTRRVPGDYAQINGDYQSEHSATPTLTPVPPS
jgi:hypothetical protein